VRNRQKSGQLAMKKHNITVIKIWKIGRSTMDENQQSSENVVLMTADDN
jgi:hypothetical protein